MTPEDELRQACYNSNPNRVRELLIKYDVSYECMDECLDWAAFRLERGFSDAAEIVKAFVEDGCPHEVARWAIRNNFTQVIQLMTK